MSLRKALRTIEPLCAHVQLLSRVVVGRGEGRGGEGRGWELCGAVHLVYSTSVSDLKFLVPFTNVTLQSLM